VAEAFGDENGAPGLIVQSHCLPLPKARGADPEVDYDIDDCTTDTHDVFRLPRRHVGKMDTAQRPVARDRAVNLCQAELISSGASELIMTEPFKKAPTVIAVYPRSDSPRTFDTKRFHLHSCLKATPLP
jgi:hypothetical protein